MLRKFSFLRSFSAAVAAADAEKQALKPTLMAEYLVSALGFSPVEAAKASKLLSHLRSVEKPASIISFFKSHGFDESQIRKLISWHPRWLCIKVHSNLAPKFQAFRDLGFSGADIVPLTLANPSMLNLSLQCSILPKFEVWERLVGSREQLLSLLKKRTWIMNRSLKRLVFPNVSFLRECGISEKRVGMIVRNAPTFITQKPGKLVAAAELVDKIGLPRSSSMFLWALWAVYTVGEDKFSDKMEFIKKCFGWSEADFFRAFRRAPTIVRLSEKMVKKKKDFLIDKAGCESSYLVTHPYLLMYSLEKRLIPRFQVLKILKSRGLPGGKCGFANALWTSEKHFMEKMVLPYAQKVPELQEVYNGGRHGRDVL